MLLIGCRQLVSSGGNKGECGPGGGPHQHHGQDPINTMEQSHAAGGPTLAVFADTS